MLRRSLIVILALAFLVVNSVEPLLPGSLPSQAQPGATMPPRSGLRLLRSDERGVVLELTTPGYTLTPAGASYRLTIPGYGVTTEPGKPRVPLMSALLGVQPDAALELRVLEDEAVTLPGRFTLDPAPRPAPLAGDLQLGRLLYEPDPALTADLTLSYTDDEFAASTIGVEETSYLLRWTGSRWVACPQEKRSRDTAANTATCAGVTDAGVWAMAGSDTPPRPVGGYGEFVSALELLGPWVILMAGGVSVVTATVWKGAAANGLF